VIEDLYVLKLDSWLRYLYKGADRNTHGGNVMISVVVPALNEEEWIVLRIVYASDWAV
jgi:hypothetical protein